jgi:hypothetical protein
VFLDPLFQWVTPGRWLGKSCGGIDGAEKKEEMNYPAASYGVSKSVSCSRCNFLYSFSRP